VNGSVIVNSSSSAGSLIVGNTTGSTHLFVNGNTGQVGIGTNAPTAALYVTGPDSDTAFSTVSEIRWTGGTSPSQAITNFHNIITNRTAARGYSGTMNFRFYNTTPSQTIADSRPFYFVSDLGASGSTSNTTGMTLTRFSNIFVAPTISYGFNGTVTSYRMLDLVGVSWGSSGGNGTISELAGLHVRDQPEVNGSTYAIYTAGADDEVYFAGKVGINVTTPSNTLTVGGDFNVTGKAYGIAPTMYLTTTTQDANHNCDDTPSNCCAGGYHMCTVNEVVAGGREIEDAGTDRDATIYNVAGDVDPLADAVATDCTGWSTIGGTDDRMQCTITTTVTCAITANVCSASHPVWCCSD